MNQRTAFILSAIATVLLLAGVAVARGQLLPGKAEAVDSTPTAVATVATVATGQNANGQQVIEVTLPNNADTASTGGEFQGTYDEGDHEGDHEEDHDDDHRGDSGSAAGGTSGGSTYLTSSSSSHHDDEGEHDD